VSLSIKPPFSPSLVFQPASLKILKKFEIKYKWFIHHLRLNLLVRHLFDLLLLRSKIIAQPIQRIAGDNQRRRYGGLAHCDKSLPTDLLALGVVGLQDIVFALKSLAKGEESDTSRIFIELAGRFLDNRELFIDLRECRVTDRVEFCNVWVNVWVNVLVNVLEGLGEIWEDWLGKFLVTLVCKREGFLAKRILLEGFDRVAEQRIGSQVLWKRLLVINP